jgi:hypothetical protein
MSGGNDDFLKGALMIAAGVAAPMLAPALMSGGAAAGLVGGGLGATGATALTGAGLSGLAAGVTGGDVGKAMLLGGLGGAALSENKELVWSVRLFVSSRFVLPHPHENTVKHAFDCVFVEFVRDGL